MLVAFVLLLAAAEAAITALKSYGKEERTLAVEDAVLISGDTSFAVELKSSESCTERIYTNNSAMEVMGGEDFSFEVG